MAFFPHVKKGDAFQPSALLENNIRDVVNGYNAIGARVTKGVANSSLRVPVWNASKEELPAGSAVTVDMTNEEDSPTGILPCVPFDVSCQTWGILPTALQPGAVGDCIIGGVSLIQMSGKGKVGDCVAPVFKDGKAAKDFVTNSGVIWNLPLPRVKLQVMVHCNSSTKGFRKIQAIYLL